MTLDKEFRKILFNILRAIKEFTIQLNEEINDQIPELQLPTHNKSEERISFVQKDRTSITPSSPNLRFVKKTSRPEAFRQYAAATSKSPQKSNSFSKEPPLKKQKQTIDSFKPSHDPIKLFKPFSFSDSSKKFKANDTFPTSPSATSRSSTNLSPFFKSYANKAPVHNNKQSLQLKISNFYSSNKTADFATFNGYFMRSEFSDNSFKNLGNTCYMNAVLQAITCLHLFTSDLRYLLRSCSFM